jgi:hypothetical protein
MSKLLPALSAVLISVCCAAQDAGNQVPFAKVMNSAFAQDYQNSTVSTTAEFLTATPQERNWGSIIPKLTAGMVPFCVLAPGQAEPIGPGRYPSYVFLPKSASDLVFELQRGDLVLLTGHTVVDRMPTYHLIAFVADTVSKASPEPSK